jgi:uncharacterized OsmC-like protein
MQHVKESIEGAVAYLSEHPDEARYRDSVATAALEEGLRFRVTGPQGEKVTTDMPSAVGGGGAGLSPGWLFRAAVASCAGSLVAMEAAREGIRLTALMVDVDSESDDRGILGMDPDVPAGPLSVRIRVNASFDGADGAVANAMVRRAIEQCPVADAVRRAVDVALEIT